MRVKYKLDRDIVGRTAAMLSFNLNQIKDSVFIFKNEKCFNGKSLIGLLSNNLRYNDEIQIETSLENILLIRDIFNDIGKEVI